MTTPYYQDEHVTLYHGDCLELADTWTTADVLVTDPPYGVAWEGVSNYTRGRRQDRRTQGNDNPIAGDTDTSARDAVLEAWGVGRPAVVFGSWRQPRPPRVKHRLIWHKTGHHPGPARAAFMSNDEEVYILGTGFRSSAPPQRSVITTTEQRSLEVTRWGHPTPKPGALMETLIDRCPPGIIADPFTGSGATLVAARNLGRRAIGVELEERYCEIAAKRLAQGTLDLFGEAS